MSSSVSRYKNLSDEQLAQLDEHCNAFENRLKQDASAAIEEELSRIDPQLEEVLFGELIAIEMDMKPTPADLAADDYFRRFPRFADLIETFFTHWNREETNFPLDDNVAWPNDNVARPDDNVARPDDNVARQEDEAAIKLARRVWPELAPGQLFTQRYRLLEKIGEGGMGEVWTAEQTHPVVRKVALKLIKPSIVSQALVDRFERERQSLAIMDHPNIAHVLDGGLSDEGLPFFAMEWVDGLPLNKFCDQEKLTIDERLNLFVPICLAIHHAHQKGIIHRDIKSNNILVSMVDGTPMPRIIDFGVSKPITPAPANSELTTKFGVVIGTLAYMSPEQAELSDRPVDTRADIYSLGVVLHELLTGMLPIDVFEAQHSGIAGMIQQIQEEEPRPPSVRLSKHSEPEIVATQRGTSATRLCGMLRGEIDWIVLKCLEKDRERRYASANSLASDIRRFLQHEPIIAKPPHPSYLLAKFYKRNRVIVLSAVAIVLVLVAGIVGTGYGLYRAILSGQVATAAQNSESRRADSERNAKLDAIAQTKLAIQAAEKESIAKRQAEKRLSQIEKSSLVLSSIFKTLQPEQLAESDQPLQVVLIEKLIEAGDQLDANSIGDPLIVAEVQSELGQSLLALGDAKNSLNLLNECLTTFRVELGETDIRTLAGEYNVGRATLRDGRADATLKLLTDTLRRFHTIVGDDDTSDLTNEIRTVMAKAHAAKGHLNAAIPLIEKVIVAYTETIGAENPTTIATQSLLASFYEEAGEPFKALELLKVTTEKQKIHPGIKHPNTLGAMANLANSYSFLGENEKALPLYQETLDLMKEHLGETDRLTLRVMGDLATHCKQIGQYQIAFSLLKRRHKLTAAEYGDGHSETLLAQSNLASGYLAIGRKEKALHMAKDTFERATLSMGENHRNTLLAMNNLAMCYQANRDLSLALPLFEKALAGLQNSLDARHPMTLTCMGNLAAVYEELGQLNKAIKLYEETVQLEKIKLGENHPNALRTRNNLAVAYWTNDQFDKSVPLFRELVAQTNELFTPDHPNSLMTLVNLGVNLKDSGSVDEALFPLEDSYRRGKKYPGLVMVAAPQLVDAYGQAKRPEEARKIAEESIDQLRPILPPKSFEFAQFLMRLGNGLSGAGVIDPTVLIMEESVEIFAVASPDSWEHFNAQSILGDAYFAQKKQPQAEKLLVSGFEGLKKRTTSIPAQRQELVETAQKRLIQFYQATGEAEKAELILTDKTSGKQIGSSAGSK